MNINNNVIIYIIIIIAVFVLIIGLIIRNLLMPPSTAPDYTGTRPSIEADGYITHTEQIVINVSVEQFDEWSTNTSLTSLLPGGNGIPAVVNTEMIQGTWDEVSARRRVVLEDGHYAVEEVVENDKPDVFRYQVWGYTNFARFAVDYAVGEFRLEDVSGQTRVTWTYSFHKGSWLADLFLPSFVENAWAPYMRSVLEIMKEQSELAMAQ